MSPEKSEEIKRLAADMHDKRAKFQNLGMMNVAPLNAEEAKQSAINYELARAAYYDACSVLMAAMPSPDASFSVESALRSALEMRA